MPRVVDSGWAGDPMYIIASIACPTPAKKFNAIGGIRLITDGPYPYVEIYTLQVSSQGVNVFHRIPNPPRYAPNGKHRIRLEMFNAADGTPMIRAFVDGRFLQQAELSPTIFPSKPVTYGHVWFGAYAGEPVGVQGPPLEVWMGEGKIFK